MDKVAWLTDVHLNFLEREGRESFYKTISDGGFDGVFFNLAVENIDHSKTKAYSPQIRLTPAAL